ncbi:uncharacterized protein [Temnothorax longispinosus]|uniref:uncharacterized protein n=1 Tax=Temnothorax longispinosus TaxID=300112 RepID=UPI003A99D3E3
MYRQILVDFRDRNYQRILWIDEDLNTREYQLLTVTYGTASAPFQALRVKDQLVSDEGKSFSLAVPVLTDDIYVDNVLFGADNVSRLRQIRDQVCKLLRRGGFELRKWASNKSELFSHIHSEGHGLACNKVLTADDRLTILGIT